MPKITILGSCRHEPYEILAMPNKLDHELYESDHEKAYQQAFEQVFKKAIEDSDFILVYAPDGVGTHTKRDMDYAEELNKPIIQYPSDKEKADIVDYIIGLENIHDGKPVSVKGWGSVGFQSAKDFAFVRMMMRMEKHSKKAYVAQWRLKRIEKITDNEEIRAILDKPSGDIIREAFYPEIYPEKGVEK